jgi:branched-chain amino acid transport system substrate-binding protein
MKISKRKFLLSAAATIAAPAIARPALAQGAPIRIGFTASQSGALAVYGKSMLLARQIWRDDVNEKGGILGRPVQFVFYDDQSNPGSGPTLYSKLIDVDRVDLLFGPYGTPVMSPLLPMIKERDLFIFGIITTWANEDIKHNKYFHAAPYGPRGSDFMAGFTKIAARHGVKRLAILIVDNEGTIPWADMNRSAAKRLGIEVVFDQRYPFNNVEFSSLLRAMDAAKPEAAFVASYPNETFAIIRTLGELGLGANYTMFGGGLIGLQGSALLERMGKQVNGIVNYNFYVPEKSMQFRGTEQFFQKYHRRAAAEKVELLGFYTAPYAYSQGEIIEQAIVATKKVDGATISEYMHTAEFETIVGKVKFGPTGEWTTHRVLQTQFQGVTDSGLDQYLKPGVQIILDPPEMATGDLITPLGKARG